ADGVNADHDYPAADVSDVVAGDSAFDDAVRTHPDYFPFFAASVGDANGADEPDADRIVALSNLFLDAAGDWKRAEGSADAVRARKDQRLAGAGALSGADAALHAELHAGEGPGAVSGDEQGAAAGEAGRFVDEHRDSGVRDFGVE